MVGLWIAAANPAHSRVHPHPCPSRAAGTCIGRALNGAITPYLVNGFIGLLVGGLIAVAVVLLWRGTVDRADQAPARPRREPIPERVRNEVWRRDRGTCIECGSRERLEFDHIVPVSRGGSNTARNLELRCEPCNRRKGDRI